jgi:4-amino-4-deoxy-L-arabinose transferase-like glycosyltransferase
MSLDRTGPNDARRLHGPWFLRRIGAIVDLVEGRTPRLEPRWHRLADGRVACLLLAGFSLVFLTIGLGSFPVQVWDEARLAVSAVEMHLTGPSLVTTYDFSPDHWSVKPPLAIWLMTVMMSIFGPTELAVRLPSAIAAAATIGLIAYFCWWATRSVAWSLLAGLLLLGSPVFSGVHAGTTGDYDAPLTLFTTAYLVLLFFLVHRTKPRFTKLLLAFLCISAAVLTKSIAGVIPGVGLVAYLLLVSRWKRILTARYVLAGVVGTLPIAAYYYFREQIEPGYWALVGQNELLGRYASSLEGHDHPFYWYLAYLMPPYFTGGVLLPALPYAWRVARGRCRLALIFSTVAASTIVVVYSIAATKLSWYIVPALPWLSVSATLAARAAFRKLGSVGSDWQRFARYALLLVAAVSLGMSATARIRRFIPTITPPRDMYGALMNRLYDRGARSIHILDSGAADTVPSAQYNPQLRFYILTWSRKGLKVDLLPYARYWGEQGLNAGLLGEIGADGSGHLVATCSPGMRASLAAVEDANVVLDDGKCVAIELGSER